MVKKTSSMILEQEGINGFPLAMLTSEEKEVLYKMFNVKPSPTSNDELIKKMGNLLLPAGGLFQKKLSYEHLLLKIANNRNINLEKNTSLYEKEQKLFLEIFQDNYNEMDAAEKEEFLFSLKKKGLSKDQVASVAALATLGMAQLSGFGIYLLASSTVGAITSALGITLSFGFYTAMSSIISFAIGPVGLILAAVPLYKSFKDVRNIDDFKIKLKSIYKSGAIIIKGNYEGAEIIVKYFASLRIMKIHEQELQIEANDKLYYYNFPAIKGLEAEMNTIAYNLMTANKKISDLEFQLNHQKATQRHLMEKESFTIKEKTDLIIKQTTLTKENKMLKNEIESLKK